MKPINKYLVAAVALTSLAVVRIQANPITGEIWENFPSDVGLSVDGSLANATTLMGLRPADVIFSVNDPINFNTDVGGYTVGGFLGSGGATIIGGADPTPSGNTADNLLFYFSGTVSLVSGQTYHVGHDDGLQLLVGGTMLVDQPGPTSYVDTPYTWTGATGNYSFELAYAEVDGAPGILTIDLPLVTTPDSGSTLALLGGALTLMGTLARRFRK
jgi:hypothetical protein